MSGEAPRWRSRAVNLVLLGTAGSVAALLAGCSGESTTYSNDYHRNVYASLDDCARAYSEAQCTSDARGTRVLGPAYRVIAGLPSACSSRDPGPGRGLESLRVNVERGGFGPGCRSSSSGRTRVTSNGRRISFFGG